MSLSPHTLEVDETPPPPVSKRRSRQRSLIEWLIVIVVVVLVSLLIRTYVVQTFSNPSGSMEPTLQIGDRIIVNKLSVEFGTIHVGDILVFKAPKAVALTGPNGCSDKVADLVKRVIGVPGDHLVSKGNTIYVNGKPLKQPWTHVALIGFKPLKPTYVTKNHYFMMGDNEPRSCDSRYWGLIPRSAVIGMAFVRVWPLSRLGFL
ncbi:MAG: signal peptidase I [Acidimicrobiales bacterium]